MQPERKAFESETMAFKLQIEFQKDHLPVTTTLIVLTNGGCVATWHLYKPESRGVAYWICNLQLLGYLWRQKRNRKFHSAVCVCVSSEFPRAFDFHGFINVNDSEVRWKIFELRDFHATLWQGNLSSKIKFPGDVGNGFDQDFTASRNRSNFRPIRMQNIPRSFRMDICRRGSMHKFLHDGRKFDSCWDKNVIKTLQIRRFVELKLTAVMFMYNFQFVACLSLSNAKYSCPFKMIFSHRDSTHQFSSSLSTRVIRFLLR